MKNVILSVFAVVLMGMYSGSINAQSKKDSLIVYTLTTNHDLNDLPGFIGRVALSIQMDWLQGYVEGSIVFTNGVYQRLSYTGGDGTYEYYMKYKYEYRVNGGSIMGQLVPILSYYGVDYIMASYVQYVNSDDE